MSERVIELGNIYGRNHRLTIRTNDKDQNDVKEIRDRWDITEDSLIEGHPARIIKALADQLAAAEARADANKSMLDALTAPGEFDVGASYDKYTFAGLPKWATIPDLRWRDSVRSIAADAIAYGRAHPVPQEPVIVNKHDIGLYHKFNVSRTDGQSAEGKKHYGCDYFILDITHDPFALPAIAAYSNACEDKYPILAYDLKKKIQRQQTPTEPAQDEEAVIEAVYTNLSKSEWSTPMYWLNWDNETYKPQFRAALAPLLRRKRVISKEKFESFYRTLTRLPSELDFRVKIVKAFAAISVKVEG